MKRLLIIGLPIVAAGCSGATAPAPPPTVAAAVPAKKTPILAKSCVQLNRIREARVIDDRTIDFYLANHEVLRNTLPQACPQLGYEKAFTYSTSLSQLCSVDIITVVIQGGGPHTGASCGLGPFAPNTPVAR